MFNTKFYNVEEQREGMTMAVFTQPRRIFANDSLFPEYWISEDIFPLLKIRNNLIVSLFVDTHISSQVGLADLVAVCQREVFVP